MSDPMSDRTSDRRNMTALVWEGPREMHLRTVAAPGPPGDREVVLSVDAVGICGSELSGYLGQSSLRVPPLVMGHELSGTVADVGAKVDDLPRGTRVVVNPLISCGSCPACRRGQANLCSSRALLGAHMPGGFAECVAVPASACRVLPETVESSSGAMVEPIACAVRAVRLADVGLGDELLVVGAGPIGLLCAHLARQAGATATIVDSNPERLRTARAWGVPRALEPSDASSLTPEFRAAIDAVGLSVTRRQAIRAVRRGGVVVFVGLHEPTVDFDANEVVRSEITIRGSFAYTPDDFDVAVGLLAAGILPDDKSWLSVRPLGLGRESFEELVGREPSVVKIVLRPAMEGTT